MLIEKQRKNNDSGMHDIGYYWFSYTFVVIFFSVLGKADLLFPKLS